MKDWIKPDKIGLVPIEDGELHVSPAYDVIHRWRSLGFNLLRYWDMQNGKMCNVALDNAGAQFLMDQAGLFEIDREQEPNNYIFVHEHELYLKWAAETMTEADFGLEFDIPPSEA